MATVAPMPNASEAIAIAVTDGAARRARSAILSLVMFSCRAGAVGASPERCLEHSLFLLIDGSEKRLQAAFWFLAVSY